MENENPKDDDISLKKALHITQEFFEQGKYEKIFEILEAYSAGDKVDARALVILGKASLEMRNIVSATNYICDAIAIDNNNAELYYLLSLSMSKINRYQEAAECISKAIEIDPRNNELVFELGIANLCKDAIKDINISEYELINSESYSEIAHVASISLNSGYRNKAVLFSNRLIQLNSQNKLGRLLYALSIVDGSHKLSARARDILLDMAESIDIAIDPSPLNMAIVRNAADRCAQIGPFDKSIELYRKIAQFSNSAEDYFRLSEVLAHYNYLEESIRNLSRAIQIDPDTYDTDANKETLSIGVQKLKEIQNINNKKIKIGRYPVQSDFLGELKPLIKNHIAINLINHEKFINKNTRFFTMGSCFARSISTCLNQRGFNSYHLEISEYVNTTFANRAFVDWLKTPEINNQVNSRFQELIPKGWSAKNTLQLIETSGVFILTLGVAPAYFDRETGDFILPRPTTLNSRVLAEKYLFRTTTVEENVDNVLYLINFVRSIAPEIKIVITVSPVPIIASFEFESCVQADCLSKSVMRLVAHEVVNKKDINGIVYWPSFEIFRWGGSNASSFYAADDGAAWHVSEEKVLSTVEAFLEIFN